MNQSVTASPNHPNPEEVLASLISFFSAGPFEGAAPFGDELKARRDFYLSRLAARTRLCATIIDAMTAVNYFTKDGVLLVHPCWVQNICSVLYLLLLDLESIGGDHKTITVTESVFRSAVLHFLELSGEQVEKLCAYFLDIRDRFAGMRLRDARFVLLELPVGNSLAVRVLEGLLGALLPVVTVTAALNRNDRSQDGITREALLALELRKVGLKANDLVVLVDEWKTGTNFHHVCRRLMQILPRDVFFFPFAILEATEPSTPKAKSRFAEYAAEHDAILGKVGLVGAEFRRRLPAIEPLNLFTQYFFWAENDRMAGYRKMQVHGSFFSSVDSTVELFLRDPATLEEVLRSVWNEMVADGTMAADAEFDEAAVMQVFSHCLTDYAARRDKLEHCADDLNAGGVLNDDEVQAYAENVFARTAAVVEGSGARLVIDAARRHLEAKGGLSPVDRYYFRGHAPIAGILEGRAAIWHRTTFEFLERRMDTLARLR